MIAGRASREHHDGADCRRRRSRFLPPPPPPPPLTNSSICKPINRRKVSVARRLPSIGKSSTMTCKLLQPPQQQACLQMRVPIHMNAQKTWGGHRDGGGDVRALPQRVEGTRTSTSPTYSRTCHHPIEALRGAVTSRKAHADVAQVLPIDTNLQTRSCQLEQPPSLPAGCTGTLTSTSTWGSVSVNKPFTNTTRPCRAGECTSKP
jgi:hypothetical protein